MDEVTRIRSKGWDRKRRAREREGQDRRRRSRYVGSAGREGILHYKYKALKKNDKDEVVVL